MVKLRSHSKNLLNQQRIDYQVSRMSNKPFKFLELYLSSYGELLISKYKLVSYFNLLYINSNQKNDDLAKYEHLRIRYSDKFSDFFIVFQQLINRLAFYKLPLYIIRYELMRRLPRRLYSFHPYVRPDFLNTIKSLRDYYMRLDNYFHRTNQLRKNKNKSLYIYSSSFIRKTSLKALLKVNSYRLFSR